MAQTNVNIQIDETLKQEFDRLCSALGLSMTTAVILFAKTAVREQRIPFELELHIPNAETLEAIDDVNNNRNMSKSFSSIAELMEDLDA